MNFEETEEFEKDFKKLLKRYKTLGDDLLEFKRILSKFPAGIGKHFNIITKSEYVCIIKARFFSRSLKKKNLRIVYAYRNNSKIEFIEIYFKGDKENKDRERIKYYLKKIEIYNKF